MRLCWKAVCIRCERICVFTLGVCCESLTSTNRNCCRGAWLRLLSPGKMGHGGKCVRKPRSTVGCTPELFQVFPVLYNSSPRVSGSSPMRWFELRGEPAKSLGRTSGHCGLPLTRPPTGCVWLPRELCRLTIPENIWFQWSFLNIIIMFCDR
jgi:hypothetical protein